MPIESVETLLAILQRAQLLAPEEADQVLRELGPQFDDPRRLAEYLTEIEWLTPHQLRLLLADRWEELSIGPYMVLDRLGAGGVSEVFKAWDTLKGRVVALKVLHPHLSGQSLAVKQLRHERRTVTRLSHPNIIKTFEADEVRGLPYFAMEYVEGLDLDRHVRQVGPLPIEQACDYVRQTAQGLQHAHQLNLVHRDIKPANLFLINPPASSRAATEGGPYNAAPAGAALRGGSGGARHGPGPVVKILDWGLARLRLTPGEVGDTSSLELDAAKGELIGTADYIAPEQACDPSLVDIRADIYSLGCTLFYLLTGRPPFPGTSLMQKLMQHQEAERPSVQDLRADVPADLAAVVQRMMAKEPEDRYQIPLLVAAALRHFCPSVSGGGSGRSGSSPAVRLPPAGANGKGPAPHDT